MSQHLSHGLKIHSSKHLVPRAICVHRFSHRFHSKADLFSHNFPRLTQNICASRPHTVPTFPRDFPKNLYNFACQLHVRLTSIVRRTQTCFHPSSHLWYRKRSPMQHVPFVIPVTFLRCCSTKVSRSLSQSLFFRIGSQHTFVTILSSNSKASDAALCPPCLHLAISCQLPPLQSIQIQKKTNLFVPPGAFRTKTVSKTTSFSTVRGSVLRG